MMVDCLFNFKPPLVGSVSKWRIRRADRASAPKRHLHRKDSTPSGATANIPMYSWMSLTYHPRAPHQS